MNSVKYIINGKRVTRAEFLRHKKADWLKGTFMTAHTYRAHAPLLSDGIGVMKAQVPEMRAAIARRGIQGVRVKDNGQLEITSRRGRKEVLRMRGFRDNDGGFGDG